MKLIQLTVKGISYSETQTGAYALILSESKGNRKLPIVIGGFEAQSIAIALEQEIKPSRPLTHDLFKSFAERFEINVKQVIIHKLVDGVFYASLICEHNKIEEIIFFTNPEGKVYPEEDLEVNEKVLNGFNWRINEKILHKNEIIHY